MSSDSRVFRTIQRATLLLVVMASWTCTQSSSIPESLGEARPGIITGRQDQLLLASAKVALPPTGITPADLPHPRSFGAMTWGRYCATCHPLPTPLAHSATDWPHTLRRMWLRMGMMDSSLAVPIPTTAERFAMLAYADSNALRVASGQLPDLPGRALFVERCSQCHELADPAQHSPEDWVAVVRRMMGHMEEIKNTTLSPGQMTQIDEYLQKASQRSSE